MKMLRLMVVLAIGIIAGMGISIGLPSLCPLPAVDTQTIHTAPTIEQVRSLASLMTVRVSVSDVQLTQVRGRLGSMRAALLVRGDVLVGTDLKEATFISVDALHRTAILRLPIPTASSPRVDHEHSRVFAIAAGGAWQLMPEADTESAVIDLALRDAQRLVLELGQRPEMIEQSRSQAEGCLTSFFDAIGWTVTVRWDELP